MGTPELEAYTRGLIDFMSTQQRNFFETSIKPFVRAILFRHAPEAKTIELTKDCEPYDGGDKIRYILRDGNDRRVFIDDHVPWSLAPFVLPYLNDGETLVLTSIGDKAKEATGSDE